jgi:hypothetical protein
MLFFPRKSLILTALCLLVAIAGFTLTQKAAVAQVQTTLSSALPHDVTIKNPLNQQPDFDNFSWQSFVALNWPSDSQGQPKSIQIGTDPSAPRVWEFYQRPENVFLPNGQQPPDSSTCTTAQRTAFSGLVSKARPPMSAILSKGGKPVIQRSSQFLTSAEQKDSILQTTHQPLVDQQQNYVVYEIRINPDEFCQIVNNRWYDATVLQEYTNFQFQFIAGVQGGPVGAMELKTAWRIFDSRNSPEEKAQYYTTQQTLCIPPEESSTGENMCQDVELGLIGFHIAHKTTNQQWVWSTFEHIKNVPQPKQTAQVNYTLYNPNCQENCEQNHLYAVAPYLWREAAPHAVTTDDTLQIPTQVTRLDRVGLNSVTQNVNQAWQTKLKAVADNSVWQYYQLIGTQWEQNLGTKLANTTMETYLNKAQASCRDCHVQALLPGGGKADFSFLMGRAQPSQIGMKEIQQLKQKMF